MLEPFITNGVLDVGAATSFEANVSAEGKTIKYIDASFVLPNADNNPQDLFLKEHIPGAVYFDIKKASDNASPLPNTLPSRTTFEQYMTQLGVTNDTVVVVYAQKAMLMGPPRLWWMLKGFGHNNVVLLNGNLSHWKAAGLPTESGETPPTQTEPFIAQDFTPCMVKCMTDVHDKITCSQTCIIDARGPGRFSGLEKEPRDGMRSGHIPSSTNIPYSSLLQEDGRLKSKELLNTLFGAQKESPNIIASCGSGMTACALVFALYHLGRTQNIAVYDGSWSEWGLESSKTPIDCLA